MPWKRKRDHAVEIHPEYIAELRRRVETGPGMGAVAAAAKMSRMTLWRVLNGGGDQRVTVEAVERVRHGLASLEKDAVPMPPPVVGVRSAVHHEWIRLGEQMLDREPEVVAAVLAAPAVLRSLVQPASRPRTRRR